MLETIGEYGREQLLAHGEAGPPGGGTPLISPPWPSG